jgi:hypothetical protein
MEAMTERMDLHSIRAVPEIPRPDRVKRHASAAGYRPP